MSNSKLRASWEGYVLEEILTLIEPGEVNFLGTHQGAEIDLVMRKDGHLLGVECKRIDAHRLMHNSHRLQLKGESMRKIMGVVDSS